MRSKLIIGAFILTLLSIMNTYSRALRHINIKDVKEKHQEKLIEQKIKEEKNKKIVEELKYKNSPLYSNWRWEISEQMTTSDIFTTTLPAVGDVDLDYPGLISGGENNASISGDTITIGGNPSPFLSNGILLKFDSSFYDTLKFNVNMPSGFLGFFVGNVSSPTLLVTSSGTYTLKVPQVKNLSILIDTPDTVTMTVSNFSFQRRTPLNVFVPLDSPEATSFIRTGSGDLSPEEKQKRLKKMLEASDEYVRQMYGNDFPGVGAAPPGESRFTPQQLSDIDKQIQDLQAQSEKNKQDAVINKWKAAGELALGVAGVVGGIGAAAKIPAAIRAAKTVSQVRQATKAYNTHKALEAIRKASDVKRITTPGKYTGTPRPGGTTPKGGGMYKS